VTAVLVTSGAAAGIPMQRAALRPRPASASRASILRIRKPGTIPSVAVDRHAWMPFEGAIGQAFSDDAHPAVAQPSAARTWPGARKYVRGQEP